MRILFLSTGWTIALCFVLWIVINLSVSYICLYLPDKFFNPRSFFFRSHPFEKDGQLYEDFLKVKSWKKLLPDGGGSGKNGVTKNDTLRTSQRKTWKGSWLKPAVVN